MKIWKIAFGLSLAANVALMVWAFRQRDIIQANIADDHESSVLLAQIDTRLDRANTDLHEANIDGKEINQQLNDQHLRMVASNDQLDSFLEEYGRYAHE